MKKPDLKGVKKIIQNNWFIYKYILETSPAYALILPAIPAIHSIVMFFEFQYMSKYMIDCIQYQRPFIYAAVYLISVFTAVSAYLYFADKYCIYNLPKAKAKVYKRMQLQIYEKAISVDLACYDNPEFYTDFVWAMNEATKRADAVIETVSDFLSSITVIITMGLFMILTDKAGLIFVAVSFILTFLIGLKINQIRFKLDLELTPLRRKRDYINRVFYLNDFSKEIRLNDIKEKLFRDFSKSNDDLTGLIRKKTKKLVFLRFFESYVFNSFILDTVFIIYLLFRAMVVKAISYGSFAALLQTSWSLKGGLHKFSEALPKFQENSLYIEKLKTFLSYDSSVKNGAKVKEMPEALSVLELKNVSFSYNGSDNKILKNINLNIKPKEKIAIVGYNGAGKTTLIKLLMRLYDVTDGEILYGGNNIKDYDLRSYRDKCGTVFQDYQLFAASISENIVMDNNSADDKKLHEAIEKSGFAERLSSLENGIDTVLTREFDDSGVNLSGGEAQKVAIARVLYKDCNIIILDEPSSALDPISEYNLNETIKEAANDKTVIFISHRLSTTKMADRIYMLENGEIIEQGSHEELMALNGKYAYMFNLQAEKYRYLTA